MKILSFLHQSIFFYSSGHRVGCFQSVKTLPKIRPNLPSYFRSQWQLVVPRLSISIQFNYKPLALWTFMFSSIICYKTATLILLNSVTLCNTIRHIVATPNHKTISLLLFKYNFASVMNCNVNIFGDRGLLTGLWPTGLEPLLDKVSYVCNTCTSLWLIYDKMYSPGFVKHCKLTRARGREKGTEILCSLQGCYSTSTFMCFPNQKLYGLHRFWFLEILGRFHEICVVDEFNGC